MREYLACLLVLFAMSPAVTALGFEDIDCFDYYEYPTGVVFRELYTEKVTYSPGDEVTVYYKILAQMESPVAEGSVRVQIFYDDPAEGEQMVDEFYALEDVHLMLNDVSQGKLRWTLPAGSAPGTYRVKAYFIVAKTFNLAGISMYPYGPPGAPAELASFEVVNEAGTSRIYFSKTGTTINGEAHDFLAPSRVFTNDSLEIKTKIMNAGPTKRVDVLFETFEWDDLKGTPIAKSLKQETVSVPENGGRELTYKISGLTPETYEIRFTAQSGDEKSVMKLRAPVSGPKGRFVFLGLDSFPLKKGTGAGIFFCHSVSTDYSSRFNGTIEVELLDASGETVLRETTEKTEIVSTPPQAKMLAFTPPEDMDIAVVKATLKGEDGTVQDTVSVTYDYSKYSSTNGTLALEILDTRQGQPVTYKATYRDGSGMDLSGNIVAYVTDTDDRIISMEKDIAIRGEYAGSFGPLEDGEYLLTVRETTHDLKAVSALTIGKAPEASTTIESTSTTTAASETTLPEETTDDGGDYSIVILIGVIVVILVIALIMSRRSKK